MYSTKPPTRQGFYSITRLSRHIYFWVVWRAIDNINNASEPDVFGVTTSNDEAFEQVQICLRHTPAINLGNTFAQHWHKVLTTRTRIEEAIGAGV